MRSKGLASVEVVLPNTRGAARERVLRWRSLLEERAWAAVRELLVGEDEVSAEARHCTVFLGVIGPARRQEIVDEAVARTRP